MYNLGYDGCAINIQLLKYKHWIKLHTLPQYVIYNIDLWTMHKTQGNNREQIFPYFRFDKSMLYPKICILPLGMLAVNSTPL